MKYSDLLNQVKYILDEDDDWIAIYPGHKDYHYALSKEDLDEQSITLYYLGDWYVNMVYSNVGLSYSCMFMCRIIMNQLVYKTLIDFFYKLIPHGIMSSGWMKKGYSPLIN